MTDYMAAMLDELMGAGRNARAGEDVNTDFDRPDVCKDFISAFCPHDIFRNTKNDLGYCSMRHDNTMKKSYEDSERRYKLGYEERFLARISDLDREVRRKIEKNEKRLNITQSAGNEDEGVRTLREKHEEKKKEIAKKIETKMEEAEKAGAEGNVTAAQSLVSEADKLREEQEQLDEEGRRLLERFHHLEDVANSLNKPMKVCEICGCFMLVNDAQSRIDDHFSGKLHLAYAAIRETLETLPKAMEEARKKIREDVKKNEGERGDRDRERRDRERERERGRGDRDKDRRSDRGDRDRKRSRSRDRRDDRDRKDRDRERRDRSRDRDRRRR